MHGRYYRLEEAIANPKPVQTPHPPIWIGAGGDLMLRLAARHADVWNPSGGARPGTPELPALIERFDAACAEAGRDPLEIRRSQQYAWDGESTEQLIETAGRTYALGMTEHVIILPAGRAAAVADKAAAALAELRRLDG